MPGYNVVKWVHIGSAIVFFLAALGTGLRTWRANRAGNVPAIASAARQVVQLDLTLTAPSGLVLTVTGAILVWMAGFSPGEPWLVASYILYAIAFVCCFLATWLRMRLRDTAAAALSKGEALPERYFRDLRRWFQLSWPAFIALLVIFYLMVATPQAGTIGANGIPAL